MGWGFPSPPCVLPFLFFPLSHSSLLLLLLSLRTPLCVGGPAWAPPVSVSPPTPCPRLVPLRNLKGRWGGKSVSGEGGVWVTRGAVPRVASEDGDVVLLPPLITSPPAPPAIRVTRGRGCCELRSECGPGGLLKGRCGRGRGHSAVWGGGEQRVPPPPQHFQAAPRGVVGRSPQVCACWGMVSWH